ncbi:MAG: VRR-NUC domain-containing protein [Oscillospiraceae bacterium]
MSKFTPPVPLESVEQQCLFRWSTFASGKYPELELLYHIPNEGKRSKATGGKLVAEGLKKGVPDICLPVARSGYNGLYIELKRIKGSQKSAEQIQWIENLINQNYIAMFCYGWEEASKTIINYLEGRI